MEQRAWPALNEREHPLETRPADTLGGSPAPGGDGPGTRPGADADFFRLHWEAAGAAMQEERYQDAARLLERLLSQKRRIPPEELPRVQRRLAAAYVHQVLLLKPLEGNRRNAVQAVRLLEKAAAADPGQPAPLYWCGVIYRWFGLWDKAVECFRRALDADPSHAPTRLELGWAYLRTGDTEGVQELLSAAPAAPDDELAAWHWQRLRAATLLAQGRPLEAFAEYPSAPVDGAPVTQWLQEFLHLAEAAGSRDPAAVIRRLETAGDSLEMLLGAADLEHDTPDLRGRWHSLIRHLQALAAMGRGDLDAAIACWRHACEAHPQDARRRQHLVRALTERGARDWEAGRVDAAVAAWAEARQRGGQDPNLLRRLALGYEHLQLWSEANQCWEDYLRALPDGEPEVPRGAVLVAMAYNAARAGRPDEAEKLLGRAGRAIADRPDLLTWAGLLYIALGNGQKAAAALTRVLELNPGDETAVQGLLHAAQLEDVNRFQLIVGLREAVARLPRDGWAFRYWREQALALGRRLWDTGAAEQAMELFASLLLADPGDIDAWIWAGTVHARKGNQAGAEDCFAEAIRLNPQRADTYLDLGARFLAAGDRERATAYFDQAVRAEPGPHTHVAIGELCAEIGVPDLAEHHFRASLAGGRGVELLLVRAILGLVRTGYEDRVRPFLEEAYRQVPDSVQVRLLMAVQHIRHEEWVAADDALRQAEHLARERGAEALLAHAAYFRRCLILLRTIGHIDQEEFRERVKTLLAEWLEASSDGPQAPAWTEPEPVEAMLARLPAPISAPISGESGQPAGLAAGDQAHPFSAGEPTGEPGDPGLFLRSVLLPLPVAPWTT